MQFEFDLVTNEGLEEAAPISILTHRPNVSNGLLSSLNNWKIIPLTAGMLDTIIPTGRHLFWIVRNETLYVSTSYKTTIIPHTTIKINEIFVDMRATPIPVFVTQTESDAKFFDKRKSVFSAFREDTTKNVYRMLDLNCSYSKIQRVVKDEEQLQELTQFIYQHYPKIKEIFDNYAAISNFPNIGRLDFSNL